MADPRNADGAAQGSADASDAVPEGEEAAGLPARRVAASAVADLLGKGRALALEDALAQAGRSASLSPADAGLARAIATATFRRLGFFKRALRERMTQGLPEDDPALVGLLATGAAQILDLTVPDHAAVDLAVRLAKTDPRLQRMAGLVNAVLRRVVRERAAILAGFRDPLGDNTPPWLAARWSAAYGPERAAEIARAHLSGASIDLTVPADSARWADALGAELLPTGSLRLPDGRAPIPSLPGYGEGAWWVQDAAAAMPARLLGAKPGDRIADLCAAPGGKTAQLAAAGAEVTAVDRSAARLRRLSENLERLSLNARVVTADALELPDDTFDAVLLDAPCSATGTIRRHPDVAWTKSEADIARLVALQERLLDKAARLVRPGGKLVYCTCSLEPEEGEAQAEAFLARHAEFRRAPILPEEVGGLKDLVNGSGDLRTLPSAGGPMGGTDGFFAARMVREG